MIYPIVLIGKTRTHTISGSFSTKFLTIADNNYFTDLNSLGELMKGKEYSEEGEGLGEKYADEYFEELKYANQWRPQSAHSTSTYTNSNTNSNSNTNTKSNSMEALFYDKEIGEESEGNTEISVKNDTQNDVDSSIKSGTQSSRSRPKSSDPRRRSTGDVRKFI